MGLIVQKYGGTSVGNTERIAQVAERIAGYLAKGHQVAAVVSGMSAPRTAPTLPPWAKS